MSGRIDKHALFADLGYVPHPGQLAIHNSLSPRRVVAAGVRWGKSLLAGHEAIAAALEPRKRSMGWVVGPTYELAEKVYREITMIAAEHLRHRIVTLRENDKKLVIRNMGGGLSEIRAKSADNPISLLGEALDFCILDEASRLKPTIWDSFISQRLIDREGWVLAISTPRGQNWFYDMWRRGEQGDPDYECWNFPSWNNPYLRKELIDAERERLPARVFSQEYEARWVQGAGAVFVGVRECANSEWQEPVAGEQYWAGLDLARVADWTVLTIINERMEVVHCERYNRIAWALQVERIKGTLDRYNQCPVMMDSTGVGDPILEELRDAGCWVRPYGFTSRSKAQIIDGLALAIEKGEIALPRPDVSPEMISELDSFEYQITNAGNIRTQAPSGGHDDIVISLALAAKNARDNQGSMEIIFV